MTKEQWGCAVAFGVLAVGCGGGGEEEEAGDGGAVDECALGSDTCPDAYGTCTDTDQGFTCGCVEGYTLSADGATCETSKFNCEDDDDCDLFETCVTETGECECHDPYIKGDDGTCMESESIDSCADNPCENGTCGVTDDGYECDCDDGFEENKDGDCVALPE